MDFMKRRALFLSAIICLLLVGAVAPASAKDTWTSVRSKNFLLIGNGGDKEIRQVATRLEQFRDVFTRFFKQAVFNSPVPTTVVVFKSDSSYKPFKMGHAIGYFQAGPDVNYITLTTEQHGNQSPYHVIFHEYVHLLINNTLADVPTWFNEGLAEYYSTLKIDEERLVFLGDTIPNHLYRLREEKMLPLRTLLTIDQSSPHYNEKDKKSVFYAQSWAFVHYLLQGNNGERAPQLGVFLGKLATGVPLDDAFKHAFQTDIPVFEKELKEYVKGGNYKMTRATFERKLDFDTEMQSAPVSEAEAQAYLGDLLLHVGDLNGAEKRLQEALQLDPNQAMANSSMGMVRVRQGKFAEAKPFLQKAVAANSQNYLVHYNYALALSLQNMGADNRVSGYTTEAAEEMRAELKKAIELSPGFAESYRLLAFINLVRGEAIDESITLLKRGWALAPGRGEFGFILAQLYMRKEDFKSAREILEPMARESSADAQLRANARSMLDSIARMEEYAARARERRSAMNDGAASKGDSNPQPLPRITRKDDPATGRNSQPDSAPEEPTKYALPVREPEEGEVQSLGLLMRIECDAKGVTFVVKVGESVLKLRAVDFDHIQIMSFTPDVSGEMGCGARNPANRVLVTFRPSKDTGAKFDGELTAVDFVPKDYELKK
jgi:tetratricopeptide (TPR) repeat protein